MKLNDKYHLNKFASIFNKESHDDRGYPRFDIECQHLYNSLKSKGILPNKAVNETGEVFDNIPNKYLNSFIIGFIDGDGSILVANCGKYHIIELSMCGNFIIMNRIKNILRKRFKLNDNKIGEHNNSYRVVWRGKQVIPVLNWLYKDSPIRLEQKHSIYLNYIDK